jgi:hypothetical protein
VRVAIFLLLTLLVLTSDWFAPVETWEREGKQIGLFLHTAFGAKQPLLVSDAAGVVPYFAHMEVLDPLGLNDYHIARHPIADRGLGWVGHELGDGTYVLDHKPDLILVSTYQGDMGLAADQQLLADPRFAANYQRIRIDAGPPDPIRAELYLRRVDGKLGIQISSDAESIPAYLATMDNANSVRLVDGQIELVVPPHGSAQFTAIPLHPGAAWKVTIEGPGAAQFALHVPPGSSTCAACVDAGAKGTAGWTIENTSAQPAMLTSIALIKNAE